MATKMTVTVNTADFWAEGGTSIAEIRVSAVQSDSQVALVTVPYVAGDTIVAAFGADLPNGDTTFTARAYSGSGAQVGTPVSTTVNVDKTLVQVPSTVTAV